jgi:hypothetical protein
MPKKGRIRKLSGLGAASGNCRPMYEQRNVYMSLSPTQCRVFAPGKKVGAGFFATVYENANDPDTVVKFTTDKEDAKAAAVLAATKPKSAVRIYDVAELVDAAGPLNSRFITLYGIIAEKVRPLRKERPDLEGVADSFKRSVVTAEHREMREKKGYLKPGKGFKLPPGFPQEAVERCINDIEDADKCKFTNKLLGALTAVARKGGIFTSDVHSGNWGFRPNGELVLIDFGLGSTDPGAVQPVPQLAKAPKVRRKRR